MVSFFYVSLLLTLNVSAVEPSDFKKSESGLTVGTGPMWDSLGIGIDLGQHVIMLSSEFGFRTFRNDPSIFMLRPVVGVKLFSGKSQVRPYIHSWVGAQTAYQLGDSPYVHSWLLGGSFGLEYPLTKKLRLGGEFGGLFTSYTSQDNREKKSVQKLRIKNS